jgi:uncharacterized protein (TIGR02147 family)
MTDVPSLYDYLDYRVWLENVYVFHKSKNKHFSYAVMSAQAGFSSRNFLRDVIRGDKNLSEESIEKLQGFLKLELEDLQYFKELVFYGQALDLPERNLWLNSINRRKHLKTARLLNHRFYEFYSEWHHNTLREVLRTHPQNWSIQELSELLIPQISPAQVQNSLFLMFELGLIREEDGVWIVQDQAITTGDEVLSKAILAFHKHNLQLAQESLENIASEERDVSCLVLSTSSKTLQKIKKRMIEFRKEIATLADQDSEPDRIIHMSMQLFPTTKKMQ